MDSIELLALLRLRHGAADERLHAADGAAAQARAAVVQDPHRDLEALADLAEHVLCRHAHLIEGDRGRAGGANTHLVFVRAVTDAGPGGFDDEGRDLAFWSVGAGEHRVEIRDPAVGDPELLAVQREAAVRIALRGGANGSSVGAGAGFGQAESRDHFARGELRQVARLLLGRAEQQQALHADGTVRTDRERHRAVIAAGLGQHARIGRVRQAETTELLGDDQAEQAQLAQRLDELVGLAGCAIPAREFGLLPFEKPVDGLDDHAEHLAIAVVDRGVREQVFFQDVAEQQLLGDALVGQQAGRLGAGGNGGFDGAHARKVSTSRSRR